MRSISVAVRAWNEVSLEMSVVWIASSRSRTAHAADGANQPVSGSSGIGVFVRVLRTIAAARGMRLCFSRLLNIRARAARTITGFKSHPNASCPRPAAAAVVVPLPFQGSLTIEAVVSCADAISRSANFSENPA